jgi:hypothetical protein
MESPAQSQQIKSVLPAALVSNDTAKLLDQLGDGTIDDKLKRILVEKNDLKEKYNKLRADLDDELDKNVHLEKKLNKINSKLNDSQDSSQTLQDMQSNLVFLAFFACLFICFKTMGKFGL